MQSCVSTNAEQRRLHQLYSHDQYGKICLKTHKKKLTNTTFLLAVKYQYGYEYHTDNSKKTVKVQRLSD